MNKTTIEIYNELIEEIHKYGYELVWENAYGSNCSTLKIKDLASVDCVMEEHMLDTRTTRINFLRETLEAIEMLEDIILEDIGDKKKEEPMYGTNRASELILEQLNEMEN